ncbi:MAG: hypothetical protein P9M07_04790 [Candidatus Aceula meridiana]|nr:hypothetical protein [Candidatus Aceula meridiana]
MRITHKRPQIFKRLKSNKGSILLISYFVIIVLLGLGAALMLMATHELRTAERQRLEATAFYIAEAGVERAIYDLRQDYLNDSFPAWDADINGYAVTPDTNNFYVFPYIDTTFNGGSYTVWLKNVSDAEIWVRSQGSFGDETATIEIYAKMTNVSPWDNAIFAGTGYSGGLINGTVNIAGSVIILGQGLGPGDYAIDLGGTAELVKNSYSGLDAALKAKVPALDTVTFNGETVETLNAELRVKNGLVGLSGDSSVGEVDATGNFDKETVNGVYVTDGWGGNKGALNVHSDNGTAAPYDLGDDIVFPSLSDPHPDDPSLTIQEHFHDNALILTDELSGIQPNDSFSYTDGTNSISMDGSGNLTIDGRIYVDGDDVLMSKKGGNTTITYTGKGTILATGSIQIDVDLITPGNNSYPTNIMGFMTPGTMNIGTASQLDIMGIFYAEDTIKVTKQTDVIGTIVSNFFDMGSNVPDIYQVPETVNHLPPGMIGADSSWVLDIVSWQKL